VVQSLEFHPTAPALFTAGLDKTLRLFHVGWRFCFVLFCCLAEIVGSNPGVLR
jgi:hypothetical protein